MDIVFDSSGADGVSGRDGAIGADGGSGYGGDGSRGGDATHPTPGEPGDENQIRLASHASSPEALAPGELRVWGSSQRWRRDKEPVDVRVSARELGVIRATAIGGDGGHGADGGDGGHGGRGRSGDDATRHRSGTDGGPGGDGGDGGLGSSGADGGDGGRTLVILHEADAHALMTIERAQAPGATVEGGAGGHAGRHGRGGSGGRGGPGGSSCRWSETEYETETYYDASGDLQTRRVANTTWHSNPGGSRGPSGSSGWTPTQPLYDGRDGADGTFTIRVDLIRGGQITFDRRYDLVLDHLTLEEDAGEERDGIFEFGEIVHVRELVLRNVGGMPTPSRQRVRVTLDAGHWVRPLGDDLYIERSLAPGESIQLEGSLRFQIHDPEVSEPDEPLVVYEEVRPRADQLGVESDAAGRGADTPFKRRYGSVTRTRTLKAQFPVENRDGVIALRSVGPGERTQLRFAVANISEHAIGRDTERHRPVAVQIALVAGDVEAEDLVFLDAAGEAHPVGGEGYHLELPRIEAHDQVAVTGQLGFREHVPPYCGATLHVTLWMARVHDDDDMRVVQRRALTLRSEPAYAFNPDARVLLVTHNNTTREAFLSWRRLLGEELGLPASWWSISRYGHFDQEVELSDGTNLRLHLEDRVAIILNQPFQARATDADTDLPTEYVRGRDFRQAATTYNTHLLIVGSDAFDIQQLLEPTSDLRAGGDDYPTARRLLEHERKTGGPLMQEIFRDDITSIFDTVRVHTVTLFRKPASYDNEARLLERARDLAEALHEMHPNRRYVLITVPRPEGEAERDGRWGLIFKRWDVGHIEVRRTLNAETSSAVLLVVDAERAQEPAFITSDPVRFAVLLSLPFEDKLDRLNAILRENHLSGHHLATGRLLAQAILVDLSEEQAALREGRGALSEAIIVEKLSNFGRLLEYPLHTLLDADANAWELLLEIGTGIETLARAGKRWWMLWGRNKAITRYVLERLAVFEGRVFSEYALDPDGDVAMDHHTARARMAERVRALLEALAERRRAWRVRHGYRWWRPWRAPRSLAHVAAEHFERPEPVAREVQRDIDAWSEPEARIWHAEELERAQRDERAREEKQEALRQANSDVRSELLVTPRATVKKATRAPVEELEGASVGGG